MLHSKAQSAQRSTSRPVRALYRKTAIFHLLALLKHHHRPVESSLLLHHDFPLTIVHDQFRTALPHVLLHRRQTHPKRKYRLITQYLVHVFRSMTCECWAKRRRVRCCRSGLELGMAIYGRPDGGSAGGRRGREPFYFVLDLKKRQQE